MVFVRRGGGDLPSVRSGDQSPSPPPIRQDLGQIQAMMCDKTGTLTENVMQFKCCTIGGVVHGSPSSPVAAGDSGDAAPPEDEQAHARSMGRCAPPRSHPESCLHLSPR